VRVGRPLKGCCTIALISGAVSAVAQVNLGGPVGIMAEALRKQGVTGVPSQNPKEPSGFPPLPSSDTDLPPPREYGPEEKQLQIIEVGELTETGTHIHIEGGVHVRYKGYDITSDTLDGDKQTEMFSASGNVRLVGVDSEIKADTITVDFRRKTFRSEKTHVDLKPSFFPNGSLLDDVYLRARDAYGGQKEMWGDFTSFTTCNLPDPHFELIAKATDIRPGKRIILRDVSLWILHKHILTIPYLSIPLDNRQNHIMPQVGQDPVAGYYIKVLIPIALHGNNDTLLAHLDEFSKLGTGIGADYTYQNRTMSGTASVYGIVGHWSEQDLTIHHDEHFGKSDLTIDAQYANNDWQSSPGSRLLNLRSQFTLPQANGSFDQVSYSQSTNNGLGFSSLQDSLTFNDSRVWNQWTRSTLSLAYTSSSSSSGGFNGANGYDSKMLDVQFDATSDLKKATAEFQYMRNIPVGSSAAGFFGTENQTPVFTLKTDSTKILSSKLAAELPFQTDFSFGQFGAPAFIGQGINEVWRTNFDFSFSRPDHPDRRFDYTIDTRFQQGLYSDNTAQYVNGLNLGSRYTLGRDTAFNIRWGYLAQHGFTPLDQDRTGDSNLVTTDLSFRPLKPLLLAAQTGYDFNAYRQSIDGWQSVGVRAEWTPFSNLRLRSLATYDTNQKAWSSIQTDFAFKPGATFLSAGFRYDGIQHTIGEWDLFIDGLKWGRLKTSMVLDYDGYAHQFTARHFSFTYDMHCAEAVLQVLNNPTGFRSGTSIAFFIRLKAFPFNTPFGVGTQGQAVGAGFGRTTF